MSKQRRRDTTLTIRLTKAEKERIERNAKRAERSITDYLVLLSLEMPIHVAEDVKPLLIELKRIGNNLNQITAKINAGAFRSYNFEDMTPIFPNERLHLEMPGASVAMRVMDLISPVGKGQRGMIVSPPKAGKTTLLKEVAMSVKKNYPRVSLRIWLI